jgi:hypothetical protein
MADGLSSNGGNSGWVDGLDSIPFLDGFFTSSDEQAQLDAAEEAEGLWGDVLYNQQPSQGDLLGYDLYGVPQEYIDAYVAEHTYDPNSRPETAEGSGMGAPVRERLRGMQEQARDLEAEARERYYQEQLAKDPLWGLQVADNSQLEGASADPYSIESQRNALRNMEGIYAGGGYTDAERAQMQMLQRDAAMGERSQRLAVMENARARGMGGGGMELMGALAAQQGGANRANDYANQTAVAAQQRMMQALQNSGQMAGQMRTQSFGEDAARRAAADAWNQYQTGLIQGRQEDMGDAAQTQFGNLVTATAGYTGQLGNTGDVYAQQEEDSEDSGAAMTNMILGAATGGMTGAAGAAVGNPTGRTATPTGNPYELPGNKQNPWRTY